MRLRTGEQRLEAGAVQETVHIAEAGGPVACLDPTPWSECRKRGR